MAFLPSLLPIQHKQCQNERRIARVSNYKHLRIAWFQVVLNILLENLSQNLCLCTTIFLSFTYADLSYILFCCMRTTDNFRSIIDTNFWTSVNNDSIEEYIEFLSSKIEIKCLFPMYLYSYI